MGALPSPKHYHSGGRNALIGFHISVNNLIYNSKLSHDLPTKLIEPSNHK
jgi:hypothetical protein